MHLNDSNTLNHYISNYPQTSLVVSLSDRDKVEWVNAVSGYMHIEQIDITENISYEYLNNLYLTVDNYIYVIDLDNITINKQNAILKFVEECPAGSYVILLASLKSTVIPTILTRCVDFELYRYTSTDIKKYADSLGVYDSLLIGISNSFDDVDKFRDFDLKSLNTLCENIGKSIGKATLPNTLSIPKKYLYFKEKEQGKYSVEVFAKMLKYSLGKLFEISKSKVIYYLYETVVEFTDNLLNSTLSKEMLVDNFLLRLWKVSRGAYEN